LSGRLSIPMPQMGVSVTEGVVLVWHAAEGDRVEAEQVVCEVTTDKVDTEVLAPAGGVLAEIVIAVGEAVPVGAPLALLDPHGGAPEPARNGTPIDITTTPAPLDFVAEIDAAVPAGTAGPVASPVARRVAGEHGVDLATVVGTGARGRIRKADVLGAVGNGRPAPAPPIAPPATAAPRELPRGYDDVPHTFVPISPTRRAIAEHMLRSRQTAAHMTTEVEVDMHRVGGVRAEINARRQREGHAKLSYLPFLARAACAALLEFPALNATFGEDRIIRWGEINLGIAIDTERGLLAPVIRGGEQLTVAAIGERIADLAERARSGRLLPDEMHGGTFTISNPGSAGATSAMAIINQPQVAILGMPMIVRRPVVLSGTDGDVVAIRPIMQLALTFDHRALDGAEATRCAVSIKQRLERWDAAAYL
jgi:pyruvate/2-oxoglutarate dehydrogenase complex dihydrolipoamide acyltransferase (E2) component